MTDPHIFTHHGRMFVIEAEGWPSEETASTAIIDLQTWAMQFGAVETAALHDALTLEREALVTETVYARNAPPLPAVREAQRHAMRSGLQGHSFSGMQPTVSLEAFQVSIAPGESAR